MTRRSIVLAAAAALLPWPAWAAKAAPPARRKTAAKREPQGEPYADREDAMRAADEIAVERRLDRSWTRAAIGQARMLPVVVRLMQPAPPGTPKNWAVYRSRFIDPVRVAAGARFWQENRAALERAHADYGVPPEMVVGIIGVETIYGQQMGTFRVLDALATLSFDFPAAHPRAAERAAYFRGELSQFLALTNGGDATQQLGSYAGAMGMPQFMPSSWARWAVDYDSDGRIDLARSPADAIGSVAHYFSAHGWQPGVPTHFPVAFDPARLDLDALLAPDILPTFNVPSFLARGALLDEAGRAHNGMLALVELENGGSPPTYVAGTENFYVITRYNWSAYYAMAVIELGREVRHALGSSGVAT
ncbi:lytic murein transglycosylase B [Ramlibacter algicola]|uniref:Lytic murein transglycosylase B n=1 Tax=Ramlibacter algicola TaxID=2795217 RepID=A0A934PYC4_9BURK|nr:lytic murein transglycosylase B [Ramlibacter algicola]MBK0392734.1 lytic murein transglycosylase B [Ramlibacter algicola]